MFFGFKNDVTFCHHIISGKIICMAKSKDDTFLIESYQLSRISIYGTWIKVAYFDHNRKRRLRIIGRKISCGIVMIFLFFIWRKITDLYYCTKENRWYSYFRYHFEIRVLDIFSSNTMFLNQVSVFLENKNKNW